MKKSEISGRELQEWLDDHWPIVAGHGEDSLYLEDCGIELYDDSGKWLLAPDEVVDLADLGYIEWQGVGQDPRNMRDASVKYYIQRWRRDREEAKMFISVPKDAAEALRDYVKTLGGKLL